MKEEAEKAGHAECVPGFVLLAHVEMGARC